VEDESGNVGASDTVVFSVASAPFPWLFVVAVVGVVVVCGGLVVFVVRLQQKRRKVGVLM